MLVNSFFEAKVDQLFDVLQRVSAACQEARIEYELIGGLAVYLHVNELDPLAARLTRDVDLNIRRADLARLARIAENHGFAHRHAAGIDMLVDPQAPKARSAVHFVFSGEKVRPHYLTVVPDPAEAVTIGGVHVAPVAHLAQMKLTSFRPKDITHVQDLLSVGLITAEVEAGLPAELRSRLEAVRRMER